MNEKKIALAYLSVCSERLGSMQTTCPSSLDLTSSLPLNLSKCGMQGREGDFRVPYIFIEGIFRTLKLHNLYFGVIVQQYNKGLTVCFKIW